MGNKQVRRESSSWENKARVASNSERKRKRQAESELAITDEDLEHLELPGCQCIHCVESVLAEWYIDYE